MMTPNVIPAITTDNKDIFINQLEDYLKFTDNIHIDFSDDSITPNELLTLDDMSWPDNAKVWLHIMVHDPSSYFEQIVKLKPFRVIFPFDIGFDNPLFSAKLRRAGIESGVYLSSYDQLEDLKWQLAHFQEAMIFAGNLGYQGGDADLGLLKMGPMIKSFSPFIELGWDGGVNNRNITDIKTAGFTNIVSGGFISSSSDYKKAYSSLKLMLL